MELNSSWSFILYVLCFLTFFFGSLLGFAIGFYTGGKRERVRQAKERLRRNKSAVHHWMNERNEYVKRIKKLEKELSKVEAESLRYNLILSDLESYEDKLVDCDRIISTLSDDSTNPFGINLFSLMVQIKEDPIRASLTREEWNELFYLTDFLFNGILSDLKRQYGITRHEQEICCLMKWNFSHKELYLLFNTTSDSQTKAKFRLKKKLQLGAGDDLEQFIQLY